MSDIEMMWLRMEDSTHPMMITILLVFDAPIELERLRAVLGSRLLHLPRFRQRVVRPRDNRDSAFWEDDHAFDLEHHLKQVSLPAPEEESALRAFVSELTSQQLDFSKPLWQFHLIEP